MHDTARIRNFAIIAHIDHGKSTLADYRQAPDPHFRTHGPKNRREFLNLIRWNGGERA